MRHRAVRFLARALILLLLSSGGMLYVKFAEDQDVESGYELYDGAAAMMPTTPTTTIASTTIGILGNSSGPIPSLETAPITTESPYAITTSPYRLLTGPRAFSLLCDSHIHPAGILTLIVFSSTA